MRTLIVGVIAALGLCVGSFLTVVTSRVPTGGSIVSPPSGCPRCGVRIRWYDNIPVVSWILLRGRCRQCRTAIPVRYPALELGVGAVFGVVSLLARPLLVPVLLAASTGVIAIVTAWRIHRRISWPITSVSAVLVVVIAVGTVGIGFLGAG